MGRHVAKMGIAGRRWSRSARAGRRPSGRSPRKSPRGRPRTGAASTRRTVLTEHSEFSKRNAWTDRPRSSSTAYLQPRPSSSPRSGAAGSRPSRAGAARGARASPLSRSPDRHDGSPNRIDGGPRMRLPNTAHTSRPWRIHEITRDFRLEDVWALPGVGGPDDFPRLVQQIASFDPSQSSSCAVRTLFVIRRKLGELLGWDDADAGLGSRVPTLRDRLPADLRDGPSGPESDALPFTSLYLTDDEWAAEGASRTMHGDIHIARVPDQNGGVRAKLAVR